MCLREAGGSPQSPLLTFQLFIPSAPTSTKRFPTAWKVYLEMERRRILDREEPTVNDISPVSQLY